MLWQVSRKGWGTLLPPSPLGGPCRVALGRSPQAPRQGEGCSALINLSLWRVWEFRNACIFEGATPVVARLVEDILAEVDLWCAAGARPLMATSLSTRGSPGSSGGGAFGSGVWEEEERPR
ncbi:hypothetical protein BRADI_2g13163v3, partial [Brachypodium distachyon]